MKGTKRTNDKQDRAKTEGKMTADGTEVDHNERDIDDLNKETKTLSAEGGSEDGCCEQGYKGAINGEANAYIDEDNDRVRKMIAKIQEVGEAMTSDHRRKAIGDPGRWRGRQPAIFPAPGRQHVRG